jgi:hypothetical protein
MDGGLYFCLSYGEFRDGDLVVQRRRVREEGGEYRFGG